MGFGYALQWFGIFTNTGFLVRALKGVSWCWQMENDQVWEGEEQEEEGEVEKVVETFLPVSRNYRHSSQTHLPSDNF